MNNFVSRIDALLKKRNLKRPALCETLHITSTSLTDWQRRGTIPAADKAVEIARFLNTTVEYLVTGKDIEPPSELAKYKSLSASHKKMIIEMINMMYNEEERIAENQESILAYSDAG